MAGAFTHLMVCQEAARFREIAKLRDLGALLSSSRSSLLFGAVSPDLPYLSLLEESGQRHSWADYMHYTATNGVVIQGTRELQGKWTKQRREIAARMAWLFGYASHLVIDATIHPIVEAIVGAYKDHKMLHFACEQTQDTFVFLEVMGKELVGSDYILKNLSTVPSEISGYWKSLMLRTYFPTLDNIRGTQKRNSATRPRRTVRDIANRRIRIDTLQDSLSPGRWDKWYRYILDQATGGTLEMLSRHVGYGASLFYRISDKIPPEMRDIYFTSVKLPNNRGKGSFMKLGFEYAIRNVILGWEVLYDGVANGKDISGFFRNWNLDTGIDQETGKKTFWA